MKQKPPRMPADDGETSDENRRENDEPRRRTPANRQQKQRDTRKGKGL